MQEDIYWALKVSDFMKTAKRNIILASASPRRKELLQRLGLEFDIVPASIDEKQNDHEDAATYTLRTAMQKALAVAKNYTDATVISADTVVVMDEQILGKPKTMDQAEEMLRNLSGREHVVITSVGIVDQISGRSLSALRSRHWFIFKRYRKKKSALMWRPVNPWIRPAHMGFRA